MWTDKTHMQTLQQTYLHGNKTKQTNKNNKSVVTYMTKKYIYA